VDLGVGVAVLVYRDETELEDTGEEREDAGEKLSDAGKELECTTLVVLEDMVEVVDSGTLIMLLMTDEDVRIGAGVLGSMEEVGIEVAREALTYTEVDELGDCAKVTDSTELEKLMSTKKGMVCIQFCDNVDVLEEILEDADIRKKLLEVIAPPHLASWEISREGTAGASLGTP
jgi:hypothetical protein